MLTRQPLALEKKGTLGHRTRAHISLKTDDFWRKKIQSRDPFVELLRSTPKSEKAPLGDKVVRGLGRDTSIVLAPGRWRMKDDGGRRVEILRKLEDNVAPTFAMHGEMPGGGALQICVCLKTPSPTFREICCYEFNLMDDLLERNAIKVKIHEPSHQISANHTKRQHQVIMIFSHGNGSPARSCKGLRLSIWLWSDIARNGCSWQRQTSSWLHIQQLVWRQKGTTFQSMNLALCWRLVAISKMLSSKSHYFLLSLSCYVDKNSSVENWRCHHISLESTPKLGKQDETFQDMTIQNQSEICYLLSAFQVFTGFPFLTEFANAILKNWITTALQARTQYLHTQDLIEIFKSQMHQFHPFGFHMLQQHFGWKSSKAAPLRRLPELTAPPIQRTT